MLNTVTDPQRSSEYLVHPTLMARGKSCLLPMYLEDSRLHQNPPPVKQLKLASPVIVSFIKFEMLEMWGGRVGANGWGGGGLQYFALI